MRSIGKLFASAALFGTGYLMGTLNSAAPKPLTAVQESKGVEDVTGDTLLSFQRFIKASNELSDGLASESLNTVAVEGHNFFALSVGGVDALRDLEEGRGVDPETFAAIYAGRANPQVTEHITTEKNTGRKLYKGSIIRLYSREKLEEIFQRRDQMNNRSTNIRD